MRGRRDRVADMAGIADLAVAADATVVHGAMGAADTVETAGMAAADGDLAVAGIAGRVADPGRDCASKIP